MCNKNTPSDHIQTMKKKLKSQKQSKHHSASPSSSSSSSLKPLRRRNRTKTRKPKYLSLRLQLSQKTHNQPKKTTHQQQQQSQMNLFPLHPENTDMHEENNVALLFSSDGGATLTGLLEDESTTATTASASEEGSFSPMTCQKLGENGSSWLVKKAMRKSSKEREEEGSEERWVCYSEVVEKKEITEEVTSYCAGGGGVTEDPLFLVGGGRGGVTTSFGLLSLKLDHEGILNAWSDKGSLYVAVEDEAPQVVPNLVDGVLLHQSLPPNVPWDGWGSSDGVGNIWKVPEADCGGNNHKVMMGQREASVLRYKEKRQSRLFAKKIRYEVRKLNAEKRPRMKGRFVKRE